MWQTGKQIYISIIKIISAREFLFVDILGNIQQVRKEMENIRKTLETLGKTEEKKMHGGQC